MIASTIMHAFGHDSGPGPLICEARPTADPIVLYFKSRELHATLPGPWHAPGQLDWLDNGCERAERAGITPDRVLNTRAAADITSR
jgi:hypothetical protein